MSLKNVEQLNAVHMDVLREIGNIGSGNAASSLASLMGVTVDITVPTVKLLGFSETVEFLGGPEKIAIGMLVGLTGDITGMMLYILQKSFANEMLKAVMGKEVDDLFELDEMDQSFISEIGNIMAGSYVNAISSLTGLTIDISVPNLTVDMVGAILSVPAVEFAKVGDKVLFIDDSFMAGSGEIKSNMILVPETDSLELLFTKLGVGI